MLRFSRPKGPGFGISGGFYLSVLSSHASLPSLLQVLNPGGDNGAVVGFGVPLATNSTKDSLSQPLERGAYGLISKDRKTILRMLVVSKEESGFDPDPVVRNSAELGLGEELLNRIRATWTVLQLRYESHDPAVYPALDFLLALVSRLGALTEGAIADPMSQRYLLPEEVFAKPRLNPLVDAREHVSIQFRGTSAGVHAYTKGLQKFALHEIEIQSLAPGSELPAERLLISTAQRILEGKLLQSGQKVGKFEAREGGFDRTLWEGIPCYELLPPTSMTATEALES
jgi:hypothetical protein